MCSYADGNLTDHSSQGLCITIVQVINLLLVPHQVESNDINA
jgi:hypothetical protein